VFDRGRIALVPNHFAPNKTSRAPNRSSMPRVREGVRDCELLRGRTDGIEHVLLPDEGWCPRDLVIGADSHTCTTAPCAPSHRRGSTDLAAAMFSGRCGSRSRDAAIVLSGRPAKWVEGKDVILHIIGEIG